MSLYGYFNTPEWAIRSKPKPVENKQEQPFFPTISIQQPTPFQPPHPKENSVEDPNLNIIHQLTQKWQLDNNIKRSKADHQNHNSLSLTPFKR
jgi:hypothetical protein